jgi:hypothetical protein
MDKKQKVVTVKPTKGGKAGGKTNEDMLKLGRGMAKVAAQGPVGKGK